MVQRQTFSLALEKRTTEISQFFSFQVIEKRRTPAEVSERLITLIMD